METSYALADLVRAIDIKQRSLQLWADAEVIRADPATERKGSGSRRRFSRKEAIVACVIAAFVPQKIAIGRLRDISKAIRGLLDSEPTRYEELLHGSRILMWLGEDDIGVAMETQATLKRMSFQTRVNRGTIQIVSIGPSIRRLAATG